MRPRVVALVVAVSLSGCGAGGPAAPRPGAGCVRQATCKILFIGNSLTYVNDLPGVFTQLAKSGGFTVSTGRHVMGGAHLADHVASPDLGGQLVGSTWNVVVLQEQSATPAVDDLRESEMFPAVRTLVERIRERHAEPLLFETWAHEDGWPERDLVGYGAMQTAVNTGYETIGRELGVPIAPVGPAWARELGMPQHPELWSDGDHPTVDGTYLAACVFYATIFHRRPLGLKYSAGLPSTSAVQLQAIAANTAGF